MFLALSGIPAVSSRSGRSVTETKERITHHGTGAFMSWRRLVIQTLLPLATTDVRHSAAHLSLKSKYAVDKQFYFSRCCRSKILSVGESNREGLHWAAAGRWSFRLQRWFSNRQFFGNRVWQVNIHKKYVWHLWHWLYIASCLSVEFLLFSDTRVVGIFPCPHLAAEYLTTFDMGGQKKCER